MAVPHSSRRRGRGAGLAAALSAAAALLGAFALWSAPAGAELPDGVDVTVPPVPLQEGDDGSTPVPTTPTTTAPTTTTTTTTAPATTTTAPARPTTTTAVAPAAITGPEAGGPTDSARQSSPRSRPHRSSSRTAGAAGDVMDVAPAAADAPTIARLRQVTLPAARQFGFPLGLAALVLGFLAVQGRLDARDPKLAAAPLSIDDDLLPFT